MEEKNIYCLRCRKRTPTTGQYVVMLPNGTLQEKGFCAICQAKKSRFISRKTGSDIGLPWSKYPNEKHLPGYSFCGPGTRLDLRLDENDNPRIDSLPINRIDEQCLEHDKAYGETKDKRRRQKADIDLIHNLNDLKNLTFGEKLGKAVVKNAMKGKIVFGMGLSDIKKLESVYYSPQGYFFGKTAFEKLASASGVDKKAAKKWLSKQALWQIYYPKPSKIPRAKFDVKIPNEVHQADLLYLPHDKVGRKTYKYALTITDIASRYKEAEPLISKASAEVSQAFTKIYKRSPLKFPKILQVDPGKEFEKEVKKLFSKNGTKIRVGNVKVHRDQAIVERFNRTLAEKLFGFQYGEELREPTKWHTQWVKRLPSVIKSTNNEVTRLTGETPAKAIRKKKVSAENSIKLRNRLVGFQEKIIPQNVSVRYLYAPGELEGGEVRRATDPIWSLKTYNIAEVAVDEDQPALYYLRDGPKRSFVREELQIVPEDTENPPSKTK